MNELQVQLNNRFKIEAGAAIILLILLVFLFYKWNQAATEHAEYVKAQKTKETTDKINQGKKEVEAREKDLYPKIDANIVLINKNIKSINESILKLEANKPTKEESNAKFIDKNINEISNFFTTNGYSNTVISR
jgi:hypothetical protein